MMPIMSPSNNIDRYNVLFPHFPGNFFSNSHMGSVSKHIAMLFTSIKWILANLKAILWGSPKKVLSRGEGRWWVALMTNEEYPPKVATDDGWYTPRCTHTHDTTQLLRQKMLLTWKVFINQYDWLNTSEWVYNYVQNNFKQILISFFKWLISQNKNIKKHSSFLNY